MRHGFFLPLAILALAGCQRSHPNVLLVTFDTTRWDHVGWASGRRDLTPMLDAMAARGTWFSTCLTAQPLTLPSHTSIMTGLYPVHHGVRNNGTYRVPKEDVTLATRLRAAGYATHAIVSAFVLDHRFGLNQGFDVYDDDLSGGARPKLFMFREIKATQTAQKAVRWLHDERPKDKPFFLWLHFFDPHADYEPPDDVAIDFPGDPYSGEIHYADRELGRVLKELDEAKLLEHTLVIFTADHGDSLEEHGERTHGLFIYESTTRVPLFFAGPGVPAGRHVDSLVRTVDIAPTLLELLGLPGAERMDGTTLAKLWDGGTDSRTAYMETLAPRENFGWAELRGLRNQADKVILAPRPEAYDLAHDAGEARNTWQDGPQQAFRPLVAELETVIGKDTGPTAAATLAMDTETRKTLAALGYVWSPTGDKNRGPQTDPKDALPFWERFQGTQDLIRRRDYPRAVAEINGLLLDDPTNKHALGSLATALNGAGDYQRALEVYRRMMVLDAGDPVAYRGAAAMQQKLGHFAEAQALLETVLKLQPQDPEGAIAMGDLLLEQGRYPDGEAWFRKALALDPHSSSALAGLGNCYNRAGRLKDALAVLRPARQHDPTNTALTYNLAVVSERLGDTRAAFALYQAAIRNDPEHAMSWNNLGSLLERSGRHRDAIACFNQARQLDPENAEAVYNLGSLLLSDGKALPALADFEDALRLRPSLLPAAVMRARALGQLGRTDEALAALRPLTTKAPSLWLQVAQLELGRGRRDAARTAVHQGIQAGGDAVRKAAARDAHLRELLGGS